MLVSLADGFQALARIRHVLVVVVNDPLDAPGSANRPSLTPWTSDLAG
jgi:hypothetical protein